uniref:Uncharacterized protein n=1 Tax=Hemiselmis andersenii TaxID=464988 RepID=A0A6U2B7U1_HEMAN|mmetsp:Transcript_15435/g.35536  ORF Transcript_15435/g.35536 Transcript_15435/m.35536 type:complete len:171 (-) Transcript_15435:145-657(-)
MVAACQRTPSSEGATQRSTHAGAVGLLRKDRRGGKGPLLTLDVTLDKLERMCISSSSSRRASSLASRGKDGWLGSSPTSLIARRRSRAGQHALQSIDTPIVVVDGNPPSCSEIPNAPRSGQGWSSGYLSDEAMLPPMPTSDTSTSSQGGGKGGVGQPALFLIDVSPSPSP